ncbi:Putative bacteriophage tail protein [Candidatus Glomeribacter gigasporarum BEG34]|uniref:Putative bacteriophage tail protein n=1 Tax=Candidatus Glomeribacter gigasporarum BEG34 TaxID=1070319 RepID=G2JBV9_9BURK|nr:putative phage tail protein [Candidatus Glomeribacter gigasporarum]CCD30265.1 Putative bacteriophage tail protein [Candidatus Glomeribacter gigasporarum BEG34]
MAAPVYSAADYRRALQALLPRGRVWPREPNATQTRLLEGLAPLYARSHARANRLLRDICISSTVELLPEWEATLGLPDPCTGPLSTVQARRAQAVARFANTGGQSAAHFIRMAAQLGYAISITCYAPFRCGQSRCGQPLGGVDWFYHWAVNAPLTTKIRFRTGQSATGEPLASWGNRALECQLRRIAPAQSTLQFHYQENANVSV